MNAGMIACLMVLAKIMIIEHCIIHKNVVVTSIAATYYPLVPIGVKP